MTEVITGLVGVVIGFVLQALNGWLTERRLREREHAQWLRERIYDVVSDFNEQASDLVSRFVHSDKPVRRREVSKLQGKYDSLGAAFGRSKTLTDAYEGLTQAVSEVYEAAIAIVQKQRSDGELFDRYETSGIALQVELAEFFKTAAPPKAFKGWVTWREDESESGLGRERIRLKKVL